MSSRTCRNQFRHFDNVKLFDRLLTECSMMPALWAVDRSWGNDVCPSILIAPKDSNRWLKLWVQYADEDRREGSDYTMIVSVVDDQEDWIADVLESDDEAEVIEQIAVFVDELDGSGD